MRFVGLICAAWLMLVAVASAADVEPMRKALEGTRAELNRVQAASTRSGVDPQAHLNGLISAIEALQAQPNVDAQIAPILADATARQSQLGAAPAAPAVEAPEVAAQRIALEAEVRTLNDLSKQAKLYAVEAGQLLDKLRDRKRELTTQSLFAKTAGVFNVRQWGQSVQSTAEDVYGFLRVWHDAALTFIAQLSAAHAAFLVAILASFWGAVRLRNVLLAYVKRVERLYFTRAPSLIGAMYMVIFCAVPVTIVALLSFMVSELHLISGRIPDFLSGLPVAVALAYGGRAIARTIFAPRAIETALLTMPSLSEQKVVAVAFKQMGWLHGLAAAFVAAQVVIAPSVHTVWLLHMAYVLSGLAVMALFVQYLGRAEDKREATQDADTIRLTGWQMTIRPALAAVFLAIATAAVMGYLSLAQFMLVQASASLVIIMAIWLVVRILEEVLHPISHVGTPALRRMSKTTGVAENSIAQSATIMQGVFQLFVLTIGVALIVALWIGDSARVLSTFADIFSGFKIGSLSISISAIVQAIGLFIALLLGWRFALSWLQTKLLAHLPIEAGLRDSLNILLGYAGYILACMLAFSSLGISLESLAVIAGALSVGIGFGLQSIVNNFVSGLILLTERPIKIGDWIVVGSDEGYVRKIKVRSTEIETFDKATVIIPNSNLISGPVKNWMHNNLQGRAKIKLTIAHGADVEQVKSILLSCAKSHAMVMCDPAPQVYFTDIDGGGLVVELAFLVSHVDKSYIVRSDLRLKIAQALREESIKLA